MTDEIPLPGAGQPLPASLLHRPVDPASLPFETTAGLVPPPGLLGQQRALEALRFGTRIDRPGFNLFVIGPPGLGMRESVAALLADQAAAQPPPGDWVYVNNFADGDRPVAIELPPGRAPQFRAAMHELVEDLKTALPAAFRGEDYHTRRAAIDEAFQKRQGEAFSELREKAGEHDIVILQTPFGLALAPTREGQVVPPDEFAKWPEAERDSVQRQIELLEKDLERIVRQMPQLEKERRDELRRLNRETARFAVDQTIDEAKARFAGLPRVVAHIDAVRDDLVDNMAPLFVKADDGDGQELDDRPGGLLDRYAVNVLVTRRETGGGIPVVEELHPTLGNLIGRIEYQAVHGAMLTSFRHIKAGALHRANGGYLLLDLRGLLSEPFSWMALKRSLRQGEIRIEEFGRFLGLPGSVSLDPDPIPLKLKVVLFADRMLYYLLAMLDPEVAEHFKVLADFGHDIDRDTASEAQLALALGALGQRNGLLPLDREAAARLLEHASRLSQHAGKLSLMFEQLADLLAEADFRAREAGHELIGRADVQRALDERLHRASRLRDQAQEAVLQQVSLIATSGAVPGQVNGLSVTELGGFAFGRPVRITCRVRPGSGRVVDIEREVELGGPLHSKGVLILGGLLAGRYALDTPMSLFASLVFEQSYGGVEGDSASSAELYALLSALAELPLRQDLAVTGSVNQYGEIQAIGGVNEKIEGFFDICQARGLTGSQGVLVPRANVQHLMLREDVVQACAAGRFAVHAIGSVDEGMALLTGCPAGQRGVDGQFPPGSVNRRVEDRLRAFAAVRRHFGAPPGSHERA